MNIGYIHKFLIWHWPELPRLQAARESNKFLRELNRVNPRTVQNASAMDQAGPWQRWLAHLS